MKNLLIIFTFLLVATTISAQSGADNLAAPTATVNTGKAVVYILRPKTYAFAIRPMQKINDVEVGRLGAKRFIKLELDPGRYVLSAKAENRKELSFELKAEKPVYILETMGPGIIYARVKKLEVIEEGKALKLLKKCKPASEEDEAQAK